MAEETTSTKLSVLQVWSTIVAAPRPTMRMILDTDPHYLVIPLAMAHGIVRGCGFAFKRNLADTIGLDELVGIIILGGSVAAILGIFVFSWMMKITGAALGGHAMPAEIRAAMVWGASPTVWELPIWGVQILLFGSSLFSSNKPDVAAVGTMLIAFSLLEGVKLFLRIGAVYTQMKCLGEAFSFSAWRAFFAALAAWVILVFVVVLPIALVVSSLLG